ncbi:hypothetical protein S101189_01162 [Pediococcus acidilactici]|nr:hypothetical protein S100424_01162 [Pediococcus acidilactici]ARW26640.1 hypothetical protein S100313_01205 [Pediococcus acidilactici]ARW28716.1 hypothetical protein S101189_01162 [Pediococcus acidilactici]OBR30913.1 hypothetical protein SRCM100320_00406 [Pediococcus acidilactici]
MYRLIGNVSRKVYKCSEHKSDLIRWINLLSTSKGKSVIHLNIPEAMLIYKEVKKEQSKIE